MLNRRFLLECFERKDMEAGVPCLSCSYPVDFSLGSLGFTFFFISFLENLPLEFMNLVFLLYFRL